MGEEGAVRAGRMGSDLAWFQESLGTEEPCKGLEQGRGAGNRVQWTPISSLRVENGLEAGGAARGGPAKVHDTRDDGRTGCKGREDGLKVMVKTEVTEGPGPLG